MNLNSLVNNYAMINRMNQNNFQINKSTSRLSSGKRVNTASDSPSDILRINRFNSQIRGSQMAQRNIQDGISYLQMKESAVNEMSSMTQRLKELSTQYKNDTLNDDDKKVIELEATELLKNITKVKEQTKFNNLNVFDNRDVTIQTGANAWDTSIIKQSNINISANDDDTFNLYSKGSHTIKGELTKDNVDDFLKTYKTSDAKILGIQNDSFKFDCTATLPDGTKKNIHFEAKKEPTNTCNLSIENAKKGIYCYNLKGSIQGDSSKNLEGFFSFDTKNGEFNSAFGIRNPQNYNDVYGSFSFTHKKLETIDDIKNITNLTGWQEGRRKPSGEIDMSTLAQVTIKMGINNFSKEDKEVELYNEELKNALEKQKDQQIRISAPNRQDVVITIKDGKASYETTEDETTPSLKKFDVATILSNTNIIDENLTNPLNEAKNYIGIKNNEFDRKYNFEQEQESINTQSLSKIEDVDMAREMMNKVKNQILLNTTTQLFSENIENHRSYIAQLLR